MSRTRTERTWFVVAAGLAATAALVSCGGGGDERADAGPAPLWRIEISVPGVEAERVDSQVTSPLVRKLGGETVGLAGRGRALVITRAAKRALVDAALREVALPRTAEAPWVVRADGAIERPTRGGKAPAPAAGERVTIDLAAPRLFELGISLDAIRDAVAEAGGQLDARELGEIVIRGDGRSLRLREIGRVVSVRTPADAIPPGVIVRLDATDPVIVERSLAALAERLAPSSAPGAEPAPAAIRCPRFGPVVDLDVDRERAGDRGVDPRGVGMAVRAGMGWVEDVPGTRPVRIRVAPYDVEDPGEIPVRGANGAAVPAGEVADIVIGQSIEPVLRTPAAAFGFLVLPGAETTVVDDALVAPGPELAGARRIERRDLSIEERLMLAACANTAADPR